MKRSSWCFAQPAFKSWAEHFTNHGELPALPEKAVVATPEWSSFAESLLQPRIRDKRQSINLTEQFRTSLGEAEPDRLLAVAQIAFRFVLVPPAFGPGQCGVATVQPDLSAKQRWFQFLNLRWPWSSRLGAELGVRVHGYQAHLHAVASEQAQVSGGAAISQQHQSPRTWKPAWFLPRQHGGCGGFPKHGRRRD